MPPSSKPTSRSPREKGGRSRGGLTTKIHMLCDALGRPFRLLLTGGEKPDCRQAQALLANQSVVDRCYDTDAFRELLVQKNM